MAGGGPARAVLTRGFLISRLTTGQLKRLGLAEPRCRGLCDVAQDYPEIANAIYLEAGP